MSRTTIDFGIDLGTTNSAIAVLKGVSTEIIKNNLENDITPSAVHISKKGVLDVGFNAKKRIIQWPDDTFIEFKRKMGSDYVYDFESNGQKRKPEELSAEVLKWLKGDVQQKTGEVIEAAVITVPAAFELHQCDATKKAAQLAGFRESPLLQEPVAAALAYGFQVDKEKAYWLVYDFGGGTFDAAIIKSEEGTIHVVEHGGDNILGGSDIDKALVSKVIVPRIVKEFGLEDFDWANAGKGGRWRQAFTRLKYAAEQAKIELSRKEKVFLDTAYASNIRDETTGEVVIEELDLEITQNDLIRVTEPFIRNSVEIAKRVLKKQGLSSSAIERVILVGGPTVAPYFRKMLEDGLRIPLDFGVDAFTVVARGAAIFAGTQKLDSVTHAPVMVGEYAVDLKYKPIGLDSTPMVGGKVSAATPYDFSSFTVELVNTETQWRSGKIPVRPDGVFMANLHAERGKRNTFLLELFDGSGRKQKVKPDTLIYTIGSPPDEQPLINSMGVALANNEYDKFFEKGRGLPLKATHDYKTVRPLQQGQSGEVLKIPIIEGEQDRADRNRVVGKVEIKAENIRRGLPTGSDVYVTLSIDNSRIIHAKAFFPLLDEEFDGVIDLKKATPKPQDLAVDYEAEVKRLRELRSKAVAADGDSARDVLEKAEQSMQDMEETLAAAKGDSDAAAKFEKQLLTLRLKNDEAENSLEWPALVKEARGWLKDINALVDQHGTEQQSKKSAELSEDIEVIIRDQKMDRLRKKMEQVARLYFEILFAQPAYWVNQLEQMEKKMPQMADQGRAARLLDQGRDCLEKNNIVGLQNVVRQLWDLLPSEIAEAAKRGHGSDVLRA